MLYTVYIATYLNFCYHSRAIPNTPKKEQVRWFSDNQNVVRIVQYGSRNPTLQRKLYYRFYIWG